MEEKLCLCHLFEGANETSVISEYECIRRFISSFQKKKKKQRGGGGGGGKRTVQLVGENICALTHPRDYPSLRALHTLLEHLF